MVVSRAGDVGAAGLEGKQRHAVKDETRARVKAKCCKAVMRKPFTNEINKNGEIANGGALEPRHDTAYSFQPPPH